MKFDKENYKVEELTLEKETIRFQRVPKSGVRGTSGQ